MPCTKHSRSKKLYLSDTLIGSDKGNKTKLEMDKLNKFKNSSKTKYVAECTLPGDCEEMFHSEIFRLITKLASK